jgi:3D (Asp-Asp-Asp) domain-containing protein
MRQRIFALAAIGLTLICATPAQAQQCETYTITAYAASEYPGWTADGSTTTVGALKRGEPIAAASYNVPMGAYVQVVGLGSFRVADRGHLGARHIDVLMRTQWEAVQFGRQTRTVCVYA